jgi:hypothetical protein
MMLDPSERASRRKPDPLDAELDALVAREVDALSARKARPGVTRRVADGKADADTASPQHGSPSHDAGAARPDRADAPARAAKVRPHDGNVVGIRRAVRNGKADGVLFSAEEEAFIEQSVAFLEKRENADLIFEEIWTQSVLDRQDTRHDSIEDVSADDALPPEQVDAIGPDAVPGASWPRPNGSGAGTTAPHAVAAIQSDRGKDRSIVDAAGSSDALVLNAAPTPAPRAALLQQSRPKSVDGSTSDGANE